MRGNNTVRRRRRRKARRRSREAERACPSRLAEYLPKTPPVEPRCSDAHSIDTSGRDASFTKSSAYARMVEKDRDERKPSDRSQDGEGRGAAARRGAGRKRHLHARRFIELPAIPIRGPHPFFENPGCRAEGNVHAASARDERAGRAWNVRPRRHLPPVGPG